MWEEIAEFTPADLDAADRRYRQWARPRLGSGNLVGFIVETERGEPAASGCIWMMPVQPRPGWNSTKAPYLMSMYTEPRHRGEGHATRIVREALRWARSRGCDATLLHASHFGERIYLREGFTWTREMRLRFEEPAPRARRKRRAGPARRR